MIRKRKALILGVGPAQKDAILYLKQHGWHVIGCSYRHEGSGLDMVDRFELIDILDSNALEALARREKVDMVYSVGSDIAIPIASGLAGKLGLPVLVDAETASLMQHKARFRDYLGSRHISPVAWKKLESAEDLQQWTVFPAMIKPACSQGQRGIFQVSNPKEARERFPEAVGSSLDRCVVIEQYLDGKEVSANLFLLNGEIVFTRYSNRVVVEDQPGGIPRRHEIPVDMTEKEQSDSDDLLSDLVDAFNLKNGPVYVQLKLTSNGPRIIEAAPRLDGCHLWRLIKLSTGVDLLDAAFRMLQGMEVGSSLTQTRSVPHHLEFCYELPGRLFHSDGFAVPVNAVYSEFYYRNHEAVRPLNGRYEKVGYYIQEGTSGGT